MASDLAFQIMRMRNAPDNYKTALGQAAPAELQVDAEDKLTPIARISAKSKPEDSYITDDGRIATYRSIISGPKFSQRSLLGSFYSRINK
jgi:hypothetical protein